MLKTIAAGVLLVYVIVGLVFGGVFVYGHWGDGYGTGVLFARAAEEAMLWPVNLVGGLF